MGEWTLNLFWYCNALKFMKKCVCFLTLRIWLLKMLWQKEKLRYCSWYCSSWAISPFATMLSKGVCSRIYYPWIFCFENKNRICATSEILKVKKLRLIISMVENIFFFIWTISLFLQFLDHLEPKAQGELFWSLFVRRPSSLTFCFKHHLLLNHRTNCIQTSQECSLGIPLSKLFKDLNSIENFGCCGIRKGAKCPNLENLLFWICISDSNIV